MTYGDHMWDKTIKKVPLFYSVTDEVRYVHRLTGVEITEEDYQKLQKAEKTKYPYDVGFYFDLDD